jgi:hypothetical protein
MSHSAAHVLLIFIRIKALLKKKQKTVFFFPFYFKNKKRAKGYLILREKQAQTTSLIVYSGYIILLQQSNVFLNFLFFSRLIVGDQKVVKTTEAIERGLFPGTFEADRNEIGQLSFAFSRCGKITNTGQLRSRLNL